MKIAKRTFGILLALALIVSMFPLTASAATLKITTQPKTSYTAYNSTAKATIKASGDGLKYQWYYKNAGASSYTKSSLTSATYSVKMTDTTKNRLVYCKVTDKKGKSVSSNKVYLRMKASITTQPKTTYTKKGKTISVSVKAKGDGLTYQWYYKKPGSTSFVKSSIKKATYSTTMTTSMKDRQIYCKVTDKYGKSVSSNKVYLRMAATITSSPKSVTVDRGTTAKATVKAAGDGLKYQWYYKDKGKTSYTKSTITSAIYSLKMTDARNGRQIYCKVTDKYGKTATSKAATLSITPDVISIVTNPVDRDAIEGDKVTFNTSATGTTTVSYQWQYRTSSTGTWKNSTTTGSKTKSATVSAAISRDGYQYRCKITCGNTVAYTTVADLSVTPAVTITKNPASATVAAGKQVAFTVAATTPASDGITYQWQYRTSSTGEWNSVGADSATLTLTPSVASDGNQYRCALTANGITVYSKTATLTVYGPLHVSPEATEFSVERRYIRMGDSFTLTATVSGGAGGYEYTWTRNGVVIKSGTSSGGAISVKDTLTSDILTYTGNTYHTGVKYANYVLTVTDADGNTARSCDHHVFEHTPISVGAYTESMKATLKTDQILTPVDTFYVDVEGGNPEFIKYQWQFSYHKNTWTDITTNNTGSGNAAYFVGSDTNAGQIELLNLSTLFLSGSDEVTANGGIWLRCKITDTLLNETITSPAVAWSMPMNVTSSVSGTKCTVNVTGGLGTKTYEWKAHQGQWYPQSTVSNSITMDTSRWDAYEVTITDAAGIKKTVSLDKDGNMQ